MPLGEFRSTRELTAAIAIRGIDVRTLRFLGDSPDAFLRHKNCLKRNVLHHDISASNIVKDVKTQERFLIDLDLALYCTSCYGRRLPSLKESCSS